VKQRKKLQLGPIPHKEAPHEAFFSWDSRHHYPMEVGAYACLTKTDAGFV